MKFFYFLFSIFFAAFTLLSCEQNASPTIYPSKKGVDPAYAELLKVKKVEEKPAAKEEAKKIAKKTVKKVIPPAITKDQIIPLSKDNTRDTLEIIYAKSKQKLVKKAGQTNTFVFNSDTAKKVAIKIWAEDTLANIRINHIKGPVDSIKGGPFGKTTVFDLPAKGNYIFSISEKPTVKKTYQGEYNVELQLLWK